MLATVTRLLLAPKLNIKRQIIDKRKGEDDSGCGERAAGVLQGGQNTTGHSTGTTAILSLQDMVAASDNDQSQRPTLSQLREPVLDLVKD